MKDFRRPEPGQPREYHFPETIWSTLPNGLRIAVAPMHRLPLVTVLALVDAGASRDGTGSEGGASLTALSLVEGTTEIDGASLTERFEALGSGLGAGSGWDDTTVSLTVTPDRLESAVMLLGEVLRTPAFAENEVERLKAERLADLLQQQVEPRGLAEDKFSKFLYLPGSRYGEPEGGNVRSVSAFSSTRARAFHAAHYVPSATTLIFTGDISAGVAVRLAERALGDWSGAVCPEASIDDRTRTEGARVHLVRKPDAPQSELRVGHRGVPRSHPDYFPILVMNALLGGLFSSRINLNLRERNAFTYGAHSAFDWRRGAGPFVVSTAVETNVTGAATREILLEIAKMREETVPNSDLTLATAYLDGVFPLRYESTAAVARAIATTRVFGLGDDYHSRYRERVRSVTSGDVRRAAEDHLHPDELIVVAVGDAAAIRESMEQLGAGTAQVHEPEEAAEAVT